MVVQIYAWSGSLCLESEEKSRFTVKGPNNMIIKYIQYSNIIINGKIIAYNFSP